MVLLSAAACSDSPVQAADSSAAVSAQASAPATEQLARLVASALRDPSVRAQLQRSMSASPVKEGKLHLATYLKGPGAGLMNAITRATGATAADIQAVIAQTGPMEMYLPVDEDRARWQGGSDLLVVSEIDEEAAPFAVNLAGQAVPLALGQRPTVPMLSIVPAESFELDGTPVGRHLAASQPQGRGPSFSMTETGMQGLFATYIYLDDTMEPITRGDPELEMHAIGKRSAADGTAKQFQCSGEHAVNASYQPGIRDQRYVFNMDGHSWSHPVLVLSSSQIDTAQNALYEGFNVTFWEDDDTACKIKQKDTSDYFKKMVSATASIVAGWVSVRAKEPNYAAAAGSFGSAANDLYEILVGGDDYVGTAVEKAYTTYANSYPDANFVVYRGSSRNGRMMLQTR
jgi:hypothetical protein